MSQQPPPTDPPPPVHDEVRGRFGMLPNFFRLAPEAPEITANLWGFAKFAYLDNPLPPLFKERLFIYLSRFCEVRYCIARHVGFLIGLGRPAGDERWRPQYVEQAVRLIRRRVPRGDDLGPLIAQLTSLGSPFAEMPGEESPAEEAVFACATHVFLQTPQAAECRDALRLVFDPATFQHLLVFLSFIRTAHFWTQVHPELECEGDIRELLDIHEALAECVLNDPEAATCAATQTLLEECASLRRELSLRGGADREEAQRQLATTFESISDGFMRFDRDWRVVSMNAEAERMSRRSRADTLGKTHWELWPATVGTKLEADYRRAVAEQVTVKIENYYEPWGRWFTIRGYPTPDGGLAIYLRDTTDRRRAEEELRESQERLAAALTAAEMGTWRADLRTNTGERDANLNRLLGIGEVATSLPVDDCFARVHPDDRPRMVEAFQRAVEQRGQYEVEVRIVRPDNTVRWVREKGRPVGDDGGGPTHMTGVTVDITARIRAEEATRRRSEQVQRLAEVAARITAAPDTATVMGVVTEEALLLIGAHRSVASITKGGDGGHPAVVAALSDEYARWRGHEEMPDGSAIDSLVCRTNKPIRLTRAELEAHPTYQRSGRHDPDHPPMRGWLAAPLVGRDGGNMGLLRLCDKIEGEFTADDEAVLVQLAQMAAAAIENTRLVEDLREADRRKDEFLATLAHELRNPLAPVRNGLQIMRLAGDDRRAIDEARTLMERQVGQMVRLIDDLMDVSRITRGKLELRRERVELANVIRNAVETSRPLVETAEHELTVTLPTRPILVDADPTRLAQVFSNLLNNAAKYTESGGVIAVVAERRGGDVVVTVRDNGVGIPPEMLPHVFEIFTQVDRSLERSQGGLGIGLSLVKGMVEMHGGSVEARSEGQGRGSEFVVRLPVVPEPTTRPTDAGGDGGVTAPVAGRRILVVDDNHDSARTLARLLTMMGHDARTAHDGSRAMEEAEAYRPEVILLDIGLPVMNGYDVARAIRGKTWGREMAIVALTGWGQEGDRRRSQEAGIDRHLVKPVDPADLEKLLGELRPDPGAGSIESVR